MCACLLPNPYLDTRWHGYIKVTQYVLCVLVLGALPQKRQKPGGILVTVSDLDIDRKQADRRRKKSRIEECGARQRRRMEVDE